MISKSLRIKITQGKLSCETHQENFLSFDWAFRTAIEQAKGMSWYLGIGRIETMAETINPYCIHLTGGDICMLALHLPAPVTCS
jgi:hypothetical protein